MKKTLFTNMLLGVIVAAAAMGSAEARTVLSPTYQMSDGYYAAGDDYEVSAPGVIHDSITLIGINKTEAPSVSGNNATLVAREGVVTVTGDISGSGAILKGLLDVNVGSISGSDNTALAGWNYDDDKWAVATNNRDLTITGIVSGDRNNLGSIGFTSIGGVTGNNNSIYGAKTAFIEGTLAGSYNNVTSDTSVSVSILSGVSNMVSSQRVDIGTMSNAQNAEITTNGANGVVQIGYSGEAGTGSGVSITTKTVELSADLTLSDSTVSANNLKLGGKTLTLTGSEVNIRTYATGGTVKIKDAAIGSVSLGYYGGNTGADLVMEDVTLTDVSRVADCKSATIIGTENTLVLTDLTAGSGVYGEGTDSIGFAWAGLDGAVLADNALLTIEFSTDLMTKLGLSEENSGATVALTLSGLSMEDQAAIELLLPSGWKVADTTTKSNGSTVVTFTASVPEPTTATLSLLALAGLAARRRRATR